MQFGLGILVAARQPVETVLGVEAEDVGPGLPFQQARLEPPLVAVDHIGLRDVASLRSRGRHRAELGQGGVEQPLTGLVQFDGRHRALTGQAAVGLDVETGECGDKTDRAQGGADHDLRQAFEWMTSDQPAERPQDRRNGRHRDGRGQYPPPPDHLFPNPVLKNVNLYSNRRTA